MEKLANQRCRDVLSISDLPKNSLILKILEKQMLKKCYEHNKTVEFYCLMCQVC